MLLSIIIPVYNVAPYLRRCLTSVLSQIDEEAEVICVDDGSSDGSGALLDEMAAGEPRLFVVHQENGGVSSARNRGLSEARGENLAWIDSDDYVSEDWYSTIREGIRAGGDVILFDLCRLEDGKMARQVYGGPARFVDRDRYLAELFEDKKVKNYLCTRVFSRRLVEGISFPLGVAVMEDYAVLHELVYRARRLYYVGKVLYYYVIRADSACHGASLAASYRATRIARAYYDWLVEKGIPCSREGYFKHYLGFVLAAIQRGETERWERELSAYRREFRAHRREIWSFDVPMKEKVKYMMVGERLAFLYKLCRCLKIGGASNCHSRVGGALGRAVLPC